MGKKVVVGPVTGAAVLMALCEIVDEKHDAWKWSVQSTVSTVKEKREAAREYFEAVAAVGLVHNILG